MAYGFVYVLSNIAMPGLYKIGCTQYSPSKRAAELSQSTGVPFSFSLVCFIEVSDCRAAEAEIHADLDGYRSNKSREFFRAPIAKIEQVLRECGYRIAFCDVEIAVAQWDEGSVESDSTKKTIGIALE